MDGGEESRNRPPRAKPPFCTEMEEGKKNELRKKICWDLRGVEYLATIGRGKLAVGERPALEGWNLLWRDQLGRWRKRGAKNEIKARGRRREMSNDGPRLMMTWAKG